ncbi:MAG TPA: DivIVA domain-containing protein [Actinomycetota bacterium]|nr:DivIVA domain-containing protein [Actinomycetota bacterium]
MTSPERQISHEDILTKEFPSRMGGYDRDEVDGFLQVVAWNLRELQRRVEDLEESSSKPLELVGKEVGSLLQSAKDVADKMVEEADREVAEWRAKAEAEVAKLREEELGAAQALKEEAAALRERANERAASLNAQASADAEELRRSAWAAAEALNVEASNARDEALATAESLRREAMAEAARVKAEATAEAEALRERASIQADSLLADARADAEATRAQAKRDADARAEASVRRVTQLRETRRDLERELLEVEGVLRGIRSDAEADQQRRLERAAVKDRPPSDEDASAPSMREASSA